MSQKILLLGFRKDAIKAALNLGLAVYVWVNNTPPQSQVVHSLQSLIIAPYPDSTNNINPAHLKQLSQLNLKAIIATTENSVLAAAILRSELHIPGISIHTAQLCRDKYLMKQFAESHQIPTTPYCLIEPNTTAVELITALDLPLVIKARSSSGSRGLLIANSNKQLHELKPGNLAEKFIYGKEFSVESFIANGHIKFRNITEYYEIGKVNFLPAKLPKSIIAAIDHLNQLVIREFKIAQGMTHLELFLTKEGLVFGEIAIRPPGGYIMPLLKLSYGFDPWEALVNLELNNPYELPTAAKSYSAVWIIHPGAGTIANIQGWDKVAELSAVTKANLRLEPGAKTHTRKGLGESYGKIIFTGQTRDELIDILDQAKHLLKIKFTDKKTHSA